jgi:hypothetical protein
MHMYVCSHVCHATWLQPEACFIYNQRATPGMVTHEGAAFGGVILGLHGISNLLALVPLVYRAVTAPAYRLGLSVRLICGLDNDKPSGQTGRP